MVATQDKVKPVQSIECTCKIQWYTILMLIISILGLVLFVVIKFRKLKLFRGHLISNAVKNYVIFIGYKIYNVPTKLCKMAQSIHFFKITGTLTSENIKLKRHKIWDIIEIDWKEVNVK